MGYPLRNKDPNIYRIVTIRTEGAHLWLRPSKDINKIIGGILARYSEIFEVVIYAYVFLSNHYHLLIKSPKSNADEFLENVNRELARRLNWKNHRNGKFWSRRYSEQEVPNEDDLLEAFLYITTNPIRHGMVEQPGSWPGMCSYGQSLTEVAPTYAFYHYSREEAEERTTYHTLKLTPLPQHEKLSKKERTTEIRKIVQERVSQIVRDRRESGSGFLGVERIKAQDPWSKPLNVSRSPRPHCYSKDASVQREFRRAEVRRRERYSEASIRFRLGDLLTIFPDFTHKPPLHRKPRIIPFTPLQEDYLKNAA